MTRATVTILLLAAILLGAGVGCKKSAAPMSPADKAAAEAKAIIDEAAAAAEEAANKPAPKVESKMNDEAYIEITARSALIRDKYKDEPDKIDPEMEKVYEKIGVTLAEYQEFKKALTPEKDGELMRKVQDKIQILEREYK